MQGARRAAPEAYLVDRRGSEHRSNAADHPLTDSFYRLMRVIFEPSMLKLAINPCWLKMKA